MPRAVVTGIGVVGPTGLDKEDFWRALIEQRSAIGRVTRFDASAYSCRIAGEVRDDKFENDLDPRKLRTTNLVTRFALAAAAFALKDAKLCLDLYDPEERGVVVGTAMAGWRDAEQQYGILLERGAARVNPFIAAGSGSHTPGVEVAAAVGAQGAQVTFATGCPASLQAISHGARLIRDREISMCLVGGTEAPISALVFAGLTRTRELSVRNEEPARASRPFDRDHAGMVLSEGACFLLLEAEDRAIARDAHIYASVLGSGESCDARGLYQADQLGDVAARAAHSALLRSGITPGDLDYICAHANSLPAFDQKEARVVQRAFGEQGGRIPVSSIKAVLGHPFGASGAFQAAATCLALDRSTLPPNTNLEDVDPSCNLNLLGARPRSCYIRNALVTSYGYGGVNAYLVLGNACSQSLG